MAIDVYLQIDGIKGESQDSAHQGWIELTSAQWGVLQPKSATASTAGGHTAERCEHRSITVTKLAGLSSPLLMQTCSAGKTIPKAKLEFMRADSDGKPVKYYEVELENVLIGSVNQAAHEGGILQDSVALKFSKVKRMPATMCTERRIREQGNMPSCNDDSALFCRTRMAGDRPSQIWHWEHQLAGRGKVQTA